MNDAKLSEKALCRACKAEIIVGSTICPVCKSYQSTLKNVLLYFGGIAGLFAIVFSAMTYVATTIKDLIKEWTWRDDVTILHFAYPGEILIANTGDGDVMVSHFEIHWPTGNAMQTIKEKVPKGGIVIRENPFQDNSAPFLQTNRVMARNSTTT